MINGEVLKHGILLGARINLQLWLASLLLTAESITDMTYLKGRYAR